MKNKKIVLPESELPRQWYNIMPDLPDPMEPPLHPGTGEPVGPDDLAPIFPMPLIEQEVSQESYIDIPDEVLEKGLCEIARVLRREGKICARCAYTARAATSTRTCESASMAD